MTEGELVFHVSRPPDAVWAVLVDLENAPDWVPDLVSVSKLTPGDVGVGTRYHEIIEMSGNRTEAELEITTFDPPRVIAYSGKGGPAEFATTFTLAPDGDGTKVTQVYSVQLKGMMRFMEPVIRGWMQTNNAVAVDKLTRLLEGGNGQGGQGGGGA